MTARRAASGASEPGTLHLVDGITVNGQPFGWVERVHHLAEQGRKAFPQDEREAPGCTPEAPLPARP